MAAHPARLALPIAMLLLAALAVSMCQRSSAVNYARHIQAGAEADAENAAWNEAHDGAD